MNECHTYFFKTNRRANILFLFYVCGPAAMCNVIRIGVYVQSGTPKVSRFDPSNRQIFGFSCMQAFVAFTARIST